MPARRLLLVHAHPDDETITTGATMAKYAAQGAQVTLLTCTLGEEGEILVPEYAQLDAAQADQLGGVRIGELDAAMTQLGVADHRFLGGAGCFRDSGMLGTPANEHRRAFWRADSAPAVFAAAVAAAVDVVRAVRPQVVITYDANGDYGHPDHVLAHRVTTAALERAADSAFSTESGAGTGTPWQVAKFYWVVTPKSALRSSLAAAAAADPGLPFDTVDDLPYGVTEDVVTTVVDARGFIGAKLRALAAHRTQLLVQPPYFALSNRIGREVSGLEHFHLAHGSLAGDRDADGRETDLFAGVA